MRKTMNNLKLFPIASLTKILSKKLVVGNSNYQAYLQVDTSKGHLYRG